MPIETLDPSVWKLVGNLTGSWSESGGQNFGWGTVPTENQTLTAAAMLSVYRLQHGDQSRSKDYYLVVGDVYHGIQGSPANPAVNWVSVGYYANYMQLKVASSLPGTRVSTFGPNSTVEQATISFSIGGDVGIEVDMEGPTAKGGLSASVGVSFSASEVSFAARPSLTSVEWYTGLPHVGWVGPSNPPNPGEPSYAGYLWNPAIIFEVPEGKAPQLGGKLEVDFEYNWTRGIRVRPHFANIDLVYVPTVATDGIADEDKQLPTIMERLYMLSAAGGKDGKTDTFLFALRQTGVSRNFDDSNLEQLVIAPTNAAIDAHFTRHPEVALQAVAPTNMRWLEDWVSERVISLPPKAEWQTSLAKLKGAIGSNGHLEKCSDGLLFVSDEYEVPPQVAPALKDMVEAALS